MSRYDTEEARAKHREEQRLYRFRHPEQEAMACNRWRKKNHERHRAILRLGLRKWKAANREKCLAHMAVHRALDRGILIRPDNCSSCGKSCRPHGHHRDYRKQLEVEWLCTKCHKLRHRGKP